MLINSIDKAATLVICLSGLLYFGLLIRWYIVYPTDFSERFTGKYWYFPALTFLAMGVMSQLGLIKKLRLSSTLRILIIILFIFVTQIGDYMLIATSLYNDYYFSVTTFLTGYLLKISLFCISVLIVLVGEQLVNWLRK